RRRTKDAYRPAAGAGETRFLAPASARLGTPDTPAGGRGAVMGPWLSLPYGWPPRQVPRPAPGYVDSGRACPGGHHWPKTRRAGSVGTPEAARGGASVGETRPRRGSARAADSLAGNPSSGRSPCHGRRRAAVNW